MKRLYIYVEGTTEEIFVERLLRHHLFSYGIKVERPLLAKKDVDPEGPRGGFTNWPAMEADMRDWFADHPDAPGSPARFTTLLDLYALPKEVPGYQGPGVATTEAHVTDIENAIALRLGDPRFHPYLQRHEFEALLLADPEALARVFPGSAGTVADLKAHLEGQNPEDVNHGRSTHPGARILAAIPDYYMLKASNAYWVAVEVTLGTMRARCPRFRQWLEKWEAWGMT